MDEIISKNELDSLLDEIYKLKEKIKNSKDLENFRIKFLGRRGVLSSYFKKLKEIPEEDRPKIGEYLNHIKKETLKIFDELSQKIKKEEKLYFDFRHPGKDILIGHLHPITISIYEIRKIFVKLGFSVVDFPEIVTEYENFDSLNLPQTHPAREMWDTLWIDSPSSKKRYLLKTHTSAFQNKFMKENMPPFRVITIGKVFRREATDMTHDFEFHQFDGLAIGKDATLGELKGVCEKFFSEFFSKKLKIRFRLGYFPFVEPGLEIDLQCIFCDGKGKIGNSICTRCKGTGFLEIAGAGMVHPFVIKEAGLDPKQNFGYAFGFGLERLVMLKYKIDDIRLFHSGDLRFIRQFS